MARAQVEIIYLILTIGIALVLAGGIFAFSKSFRASLNEQLAAAGLERTAGQLEAGFLQLKALVDSTEAQNISLKLAIPQRIGEQRYTIAGDGSAVIELRTIGDPSIPKRLAIRFWPVSIHGFVDSAQGFVVLQLQNASSVLLK